MITREEQETIITFNEKDPEANIYTFNGKLQRQFEQLAKVSPSVHAEACTEGAKSYNFPKTWMKVRKPRELTEEKRQELSERAKRNFGKKEEVN